MVNQLHHKICGLENYGPNKRYVCLDGCYMYISPGEHNKLAMEEPIPVGTILECEYSHNYWTYTTYNGVSGWIIDIDMDTYDGTSMVAEIAGKENEIITTVDVLLYEQPYQNGKLIDKIPKNTKLATKYLYGFQNHGYWGYFMVIYNNKIGWISSEDCAFKIGLYDRKLEFIEDLIIDGKCVIGKGEIVELTSNYAKELGGDGIYNYYFLYNGYNFSQEDVEAYNLDDLRYIMLFEQFQDLPINQKIPVKKIEEKYYEDFDSGFYSEDWHLEYNGKCYSKEDFKNCNYVLLDENGTIDIEEQIKQSGETSTSGEDSSEEVINIFDIQNQKKEQSNINMAILCICGAVVLALTAVVIIILANKKLAEVSQKNIISEDDVDWKETNTKKS